MATVKIQNNIFDDNVKELHFSEDIAIKDIIRDYTDGDVYTSNLVECYDSETGKTYYASIEEDSESINAIIQVNNKDETLDYIAKATDIVSIIITPAGGSALEQTMGFLQSGQAGDYWNWWGALGGYFAGTLEGGLYGLSVGGPWGMLIGAIIGGTVGIVGGGLGVGAATSNYNNAKNKKTLDNGIDSKQLPDVRGASNQALTGQCFPLVLGKHLVTPFIVGSPYNEISGSHGEINYICCQYVVGYAPLKLTDFKLGDMYLAHNKKWSGNEHLRTIFHGKLSGIDSPSASDALSYYQSATTIDLYNRPLISGATMKAAGWEDFPEESTATVYSSIYSNEYNTKAVLVTPILNDGTVLTPAQLELYATDLLEDKQIPVMILLNKFEGVGVISQAEVYAENLHKAQEMYYFNSPSGDIVNTWRNNDISLEILQQDQNDEEIDYGTVYPFAKIQNQVNAKVLYIADGSLADIDSEKRISYKGAGLKNGLRNNPVQFTEQYPKSAKVELNFDRGLCKVRSETSGSETKMVYSRIPLWVAVQWRVYSEDNAPSDGNNPDEEIIIPTYDYESKTYSTTKRGWHSFSYLNGIPNQIFTAVNREDDVKAHTGNNFKFKVSAGGDSETSSGAIGPAPIITKSYYTAFTNGWTQANFDAWNSWSDEQKNALLLNFANTLYQGHPDVAAAWIQYFQIENPDYLTATWSTSDTPSSEVIPDEQYAYTKINDSWIGHSLFNLESLGGTNDDTNGLNQFRCISQVDFIDWARSNLMTEGDTEEILAQKIKAYFFGSSNTARAIEVRVVRISPNYIDETKNTDENKSAYTFNDTFTWTYLTSEMLDGDKLMQSNEIEQKRPLSEENMRKLCVISLKAKIDGSDQLSNVISSFNCIAESFAPYYDNEQKKWFPESVNKSTKYYRPVTQDDILTYTEISESEFLSDRQAEPQVKSIQKKAGNNFTKQIVNLIRTNNHKDSFGRYYISENDEVLKYCTNNVASMFLLAGLGPHLGFEALSYEQSLFKNNELLSDIGDFDLISFAEWYKWAEDVTDGSTYNSDGYHVDKNGNYVSHRKDDLVHIKFAANAYIYEADTLENIFSKIAIAGRAIYTRDSNNRLRIVVDKPEKYPVALINQQNTLSSSYNINYKELPSGIQLVFPDENDGYLQNELYCMVRGEKKECPRGDILQYSVPFVTNPMQQHSLGCYFLANLVLNKEVITKELGLEGVSIKLGDLVLMQDATILIGTDSGARISKLLEDDEAIYGCLVNNTYKYTGEEETVEINNEPRTLCKQGIVVMQPAQFKQSTVIALRLARNGTSCLIDNVEYTLRKGTTNLVLFDIPIAKTQDGNGDYYVYKPEVDNIVGFGIVGKTAGTYRVVNVKPKANQKYTFTLCPYQDELYNYGQELPSFQNNMTIPDRSQDYNFDLSDTVTKEDLIKHTGNLTQLAQNAVTATFGQTPLAPQRLTASVSRDCIQLSCDVDTQSVNNVDHIVYEITKYRLANNVLEEKVEEIKGSYSTEYYFDRDWEGYPEKKGAGVVENDGSLEFWKIRAKSVSFYSDTNENESAWTNYVNITPNSLAAYGTWFPPMPVNISFIAEEEGITASWNSDITNVYGTVQYEVLPYYNSTPLQSQTVVTRSATYQFDRATDGYPEKSSVENLPSGTKIINNYNVRVRAINTMSGKTRISDVVPCNISRYKTWIPSKPNVVSRVSNRNVTLSFSQNNDCYGLVQFLVGIRRYDDIENHFFVPNLNSNPYSSESVYKLISHGNSLEGYLESPVDYSQTLPLKTQNGTQKAVDYNLDESDNKIITIPLSRTLNKVLVLSLGGFAPVDTSYQFEVYAFNKSVEDYYDETAHIEHNYQINTYHKISAAERKSVIALATSVQDVLNGSIISDKIGKGAITETKIEDDAISTPKLKTNAVVADKIYTYNMLTLTQGIHTLSGYAYDEINDTEIKKLLDDIKRNKEESSLVTEANINKLDRIIKSKSTSYWMGLDTEHPEFYMGNVKVSEKHSEGATYFHYYYDNVMGETNLDIKLSNFIVTAVSSTIRGFFNVRNKSGSVRYSGSNSFLQVNPETESKVLGESVDGYYNANTDKFYYDSTFTDEISPNLTSVYEDCTDNSNHKYYQFNGTGYYPVDAVDSETMILKGDLKIVNKNTKEAGSNKYKKGSLYVGGLSELGTLLVHENASLEKSLTVGLETGESDSINKGLLKVFGDLSVSKNISTNTLLIGDTENVSSDTLLTIAGKSAFKNDVAINGSLNISSNVYTNYLYSPNGNSSKIYTGPLESNGNIKSSSINTGSISASSISGGTVSGSRIVVPRGRPSGAGIGDIWVN